MARLLQWFFILFPVVFSLQTAQQYELPKVAFFLVIACGILAFVRGYEILAYQKSSFSLIKEHSGFFIAVAGYLGYLILNTYLALSPMTSFWGSYERHQGLFLISGIVFFMLMILTRPWKKEELHEMLWGIILGGFLVSLTALWQLMFSVLSQNTSFFSSLEVIGGRVTNPFGEIALNMGRVSGALGHPNFLGQYLVTTVLLHIFFIFRDQHVVQWKKIVLRGSFFLQIFILLATGNRASIAAFLIGVCCIGLYSYKSMVTVEIKERLRPYLIKALLLFSGALLLYVSIKIFDANFTRSLLTRAYLVPSILQMIGKSPWIGYGLDSFSYAFSPFFPTGMGETESLLTIPDRAHNVVLDTLVEEGILGILLGAFCLYQLYRMIRTVFLGNMLKDMEERLLCVVLIVSLCMTELSYLAGFSTTSTKVLSAMILCILLVLLPSKSLPTNTKPVYGVVTALICTVLGTMYCSFGSRMYLGDVAYAHAKNTNTASDLIRSIDLSPSNYQYLLFGVDSMQEPEDKLYILEKAEKQNTVDFFVKLQKGRVYAGMGQKDLAIASFDAAKNLCPNCPIIPLYAGEALNRLGDMVLAKQYFELYLSHMPSYYKKVYIDHSSSSTLSAYEQERLRIFLKENGEYLDFVNGFFEKQKK